MFTFSRAGTSSVETHGNNGFRGFVQAYSFITGYLKKLKKLRTGAVSYGIYWRKNKSKKFCETWSTSKRALAINVMM
jgi:hypothetical protein